MDLLMLVLDLAMFALSIVLFGYYASHVDAFYPQRVRPGFELPVGVSVLAVVSTQVNILSGFFGNLGTVSVVGSIVVACLTGALLPLVFWVSIYVESWHSKRIQGGSPNVVVCCMCGYHNTSGVSRCSECGFPISPVVAAGTARFFGVLEKNKNSPNGVIGSNGPNSEWQKNLFFRCVYASLPGLALAGLFLALNASLWFSLLSLICGMVYAGYATRRYADRYYESERFIELVRSLGSRVASSA